MEDFEKETSNKLNQLIQSFFRAQTLNEAKNVLQKIKETLKELSEFYKQKGNQIAVKLVNARIRVWEAYEIYVNSKIAFLQSDIPNEKGQFEVAFSKGKVIFQTSKKKGVLTPGDILNRMKVASDLIRFVITMQDAPYKTTLSLKEVYKFALGVEDQRLLKTLNMFLKNWFNVILTWKYEILKTGVIIAIIKGDIEEYKKVVDKYREILAQLEALYKGQQYQKVKILEQGLYEQIKSRIASDYYDLTSRKSGWFSGGGTKDILTFINNAEPIQDIIIPASVYELTLKELFPKELEK
ncbi:MAG: hypothetical protein ACTSQY_07485 [Candidatus Odinarchaeia archaeon]